MTLSILTPREVELVRLLSQGLKNKEIAEAMGLTEFVTKKYLTKIYEKTGMWHRTELALWYLHHAVSE